MSAILTEYLENIIYTNNIFTETKYKTITEIYTA